MASLAADWTLDKMRGLECIVSDVSGPITARHPLGENAPTP